MTKISCVSAATSYSKLSLDIVKENMLCDLNSTCSFGAIYPVPCCQVENIPKQRDAKIVEQTYSESLLAVKSARVGGTCALFSASQNGKHPGECRARGVTDFDMAQHAACHRRQVQEDEADEATFCGHKLLFDVTVKCAEGGEESASFFFAPVCAHQRDTR